MALPSGPKNHSKDGGGILEGRERGEVRVQKEFPAIPGPE